MNVEHFGNIMSWSILRGETIRNFDAHTDDLTHLCYRFIPYYYYIIALILLTACT